MLLLAKKMMEDTLILALTACPQQSFVLSFGYIHLYLHCLQHSLFEHLFNLYKHNQLEF